MLVSDTSGLYYKAITIVNDDSRVVNMLETSLTDNASRHFQLSHVYITGHCTLGIINDTSRSANDASGCVINESRVMLQILASLL